jgi:hypothetical protein
MPSRTCPQNAHQSGVCGCPSFWKTLAPNPVVIDLTPEDADREAEDLRFDMYTVDRLFGPDSHHGSIRDVLTLRGTPVRYNSPRRLSALEQCLRVRLMGCWSVFRTTMRLAFDA